MQTLIKQAQDFAHEADGYVDCLREMNAAAHDGISIDFSSWGEDAEPLISLESNTFESLVDIYTDFYSSKRQRGARASRAAGVRLGRREKKLPEKFDSVAELWREGKLTVRDGARLCGMAQSTFYKKAKKLGKAAMEPPKMPLKVKHVCKRWSGGELTLQEAAEKLGISEASFRKIVRDYSITKQYVPNYFDKYYELWVEGKISKKDAAQLCNMSVQKFDACLHKREQERNKGI